jgi:hypothetical protein
LAVVLHCIATLFTIGLSRINSFPIVARTDRIENTAALLSFPSNNLETDHKENMSCGVYRVFLSGFTISIYYLIPYILDDYNTIGFILQKEKERGAKYTNNRTL